MGENSFTGFFAGLKYAKLSDQEKTGYLEGIIKCIFNDSISYYDFPLSIPFYDNHEDFSGLDENQGDLCGMVCWQLAPE